MLNLLSLLNIKNPGGELRSGIISYILKDTFTTAVAAGSVNGTTADTGQTRTVTDINSKISITGGQLSFATGLAASSGLWYPSQTRVAGKMLLGSINTNGISSATLGWSTAQNVSTLEAIRFLGGAILQVILDSTGIAVGTYSTSTNYSVLCLQKASGEYFFIKGGTEFPNWTLLYYSTNRATNFFPGVHNTGTTVVFTADNIRIPSSLWLPTPLAYDTFTRSNGAIGSTETVGPDSQNTPSLAWVGSTFTISGNAAIGTPVTFGSEITTDGGIENWTNATTPTNWTPTVAGTSTINKETSIIHGGSSAARLDVDASNSSASIAQNVTTVVDQWYLLSVWLKASTTGKQARIDFTGVAGKVINLTTTYTQYFASRKATATTTTITPINRSNVTSASMYGDDVSMKVLTLSELIASVSTATKDVIADVNITIPTDAIEAGVIINLDSTSAPANFVLGTLSFNNVGGIATLYKCVAGTYTSVISAAVTYAAGATLRVIKDGTSYQLFYNNLKVGSTSTISDAGIISNTLHGLFSTYSSATLDNFLLFPRGTTNNEYAALDSY